MVTVSEGLVQLLEQRFAIQPLLIRNVHDHAMDSEPSRVLRGDLGLQQESPPVALIIGNYKPAMHLEALFSAVECSAYEITLALLGRNYRRFNLSPAAMRFVNLVPPVLPTEVVPYARDADFAIVPYVARTANDDSMLPNGLFQSLAAGLPAIVPRLPEIEALMGDYPAELIVDFRDRDQIIDALNLLADANFRCQIRLQIKQIAQKVSWDNEVVPIINFLEDLRLKTI